jgi:photosystem II stability/assembly factor-like uncharacterized protein
MAFVKAAVFFVALAALATTAQAQNWVPVGPPGGDVRSLIQDPGHPNRVYLGTSRGVLYRSDDAGLHWERMPASPALSGSSLDELAVDPEGNLWIGYWEVQGRGGGVARSTDGGRSFNTFMRGESVRALAIAPSDPQTIAAGSLNGVFLSHDAGEHWEHVTAPDDAALHNVESLAFDPGNAQVLYMGTWHLAWKTEDGGETWNPIHQGMIDDSHVMTLNIDPWDSQTVYATACTGIYRSRDGGDHWTKLEGIPESSRRTRAFCRNPLDPKMLIAGTTEGVWLSTNRGETWKPVTDKDLVTNALIAQPNGTLLLGSEGAGVLKSSDYGRTWVGSNTGFSERFISRVLFDPDGKRVLAGVWGDAHYGGVFTASHLPGPWKHLDDGLFGRQVLSLALLNGTILAGTDDGIFAWPSGGRRWERMPMSGGITHPRINDLVAVAPNDLVAATPRGILHSSDAGRTWTERVFGAGEEVSALISSPYDPKLVMGASKNGIWKSRDAGHSWRRVSNGLRGRTPHALAFMPFDDRVIYATAYDGLFRSSDQGLTWERVKGGVPRSDLTGIAVSPDGRTLYASDFSFGGIFRSEDAGASWRRMSTPGLASDRVWTLALDPAAPDRLLAVASAGGLHLLITSSGATGANATGAGTTETPAAGSP